MNSHPPQGLAVKYRIIAAAAAAIALTSFGIGRATAPTPEPCLTALDESERAFGLTADALSLSGDAVIAAATWDTPTLERITRDVEGITKDMGDGTQYRAAATECRGGAR